MKNLRPLLNANLAPAVSEPASKVPCDFIKVAKSKILPGRLQTGRMAKKQKNRGIYFGVFLRSHEKSKTTFEC